MLKTDFNSRRGLDRKGTFKPRAMKIENTGAGVHFKRFIMVLLVTNLLHVKNILYVTKLFCSTTKCREYFKNRYIRCRTA